MSRGRCSACFLLGFTLLEVLAALAIAATGLLAVSNTVSNSIDVSSATRNRTIAGWVASNAMTELRLSTIWPSPGNSTQESSMGGVTWMIKRNVIVTGDEDVVRVNFEVLDNQRVMARLSGYLTRIEPPKKEQTGDDDDS